MDGGEIHLLKEWAMLSQAAHVGSTQKNKPSPGVVIVLRRRWDSQQTAVCWGSNGALVFWIYHSANPPSLVNGTQQVVGSNSAGRPNLSPFISTWWAERLSCCSRHLTTVTFIYWLHFALRADFTAPQRDAELMLNCSLLVSVFSLLLLL